MNMVLAVAATAICAYLLGSISFGIIFTRLFEHKDIRTMGSGNAGMTNVLRSAGTLPGALTGVGDFAKGVTALLLGSAFFDWVGLPGYTGKCLAAFCVLAGHIYPLFFKFRGGKGVMTSGGVLLILNPYLLLVEAAVFAGVFTASRIVSLASVCGAVLLPIANLVICLVTESEALFSTVFMALMGGLILFTHRSNIRRLLNGTERKLVIRKKDGR